MFTHSKWHFDDLSLCLLTTHNQNDPLNSTLSFVSVCMFETERSDNIAYLLRSPHDHTPTQVKPLFRSNFGLYVYSCSDFFFCAEEIRFTNAMESLQNIKDSESVLVDNKPILLILLVSVQTDGMVNTHSHTLTHGQSHDEEQK